MMIALQLFFGLGIDINGVYKYDRNSYKGIIQVEHEVKKDWVAGYWHSSELDNGFRGNVHDENIFYIKKRIDF